MSAQAVRLIQPMRHAHGAERAACFVQEFAPILGAVEFDRGRCDSELTERDQWAHCAAHRQIEGQIIGRAHAREACSIRSFNLRLAEPRPCLVAALTLLTGSLHGSCCRYARFRQAIGAPDRRRRARRKGNQSLLDDDAVSLA